MSALLEARGLVIRAGTATILHGVDLSVQPREVIALVGPNGAGKSTLLRALSGEVRPTAGTISLKGRPLRSYTPQQLAKHRAVLAQHTTVTFPFTVSEIVRMGYGPSGRDSGSSSILSEILRCCDISHLEHKPVTRLSGGEQQRVHLARTLIQLQSSPQKGERVLLLDEPTASLDLAHQLLVVDLVKRQAAEGTAVIVVLHDLNLAAMLASRVVMMKAGAVVVSDAPSRVISNETIRTVFGVSQAVGQFPANDVPFVLPQSMRIGD